MERRKGHSGGDLKKHILNIHCLICFVYFVFSIPYFWELVCLGVVGDDIMQIFEFRVLPLCSHFKR